MTNRIKKLTNKGLVTGLMFMASFMAYTADAQTKYTAKNVSINVSGTSTLHDWTEKSTAGTSDAVFHVADGKLTRVASLAFTMPTKTLKSEHNLMDKNTYKALKADQHQNISYTITSASVTPAGGNKYNVNTRGKLTIAGTTREVDIAGSGVLNTDNSITVTGSEKMKMTDFGVTPPKVMLIKTGNDITISFTAKYTR